MLGQLNLSSQNEVISSQLHEDQSLLNINHLLDDGHIFNKNVEIHVENESSRLESFLSCLQFTQIKFEFRNTNLCKEKSLFIAIFEIFKDTWYGITSKEEPTDLKKFFIQILFSVSTTFFTLLYKSLKYFRYFFMNSLKKPCIFA